MAGRGRRRDRAIGALLGLAIGDAVGTSLEFSVRDEVRPVRDMVGGGPFRLHPGEWTDDTAMALCLADSIVACDGLDQLDLMQRFCRWLDGGENSCVGFCFGIGGTTRRALGRFQQTGRPAAGSTDPNSAGNGSLMRLAPVAIRWHADRAAAEAAARAQSVTTHAASAPVEACAFFTHVLLDAIEGRSKKEVLRPREWPADAAVDAIARGSWHGKPRDEISSSGCVIHTLEAALWSVGKARNFRDAVLTAANLCDDADTVAAVTGQLAGALWGTANMPPEWIARLAWSNRIRETAEKLYDPRVS